MTIHNTTKTFHRGLASVFSHYIICILAIACAVSLSSCINPQVYSTVQHHAISLNAESIKTSGIAFITPSTVTGQEEDKQALALIFSEVLAEMRPDITVVPLSETLAAVTKSGLTTEYKLMFEEFYNSGVFDYETLDKVGQATGVRYLAQLKLASFSQGTIGRWSLLGIRMAQTKYANIRLFFQIWDSSDGTIAWEGVEELNYARDTSKEKSIAFRTVVETAARNLASQLPK